MNTTCHVGLADSWAEARCSRGLGGRVPVQALSSQQKKWASALECCSPSVDLGRQSPGGRWRGSALAPAGGRAWSRAQRSACEQPSALWGRRKCENHPSRPSLNFCPVLRVPGVSRDKAAWAGTGRDGRETGKPQEAGCSCRVSAPMPLPSEQFVFSVPEDHLPAAWEGRALHMARSTHLQTHRGGAQAGPRVLA